MAISDAAKKPLARISTRMMMLSKISEPVIGYHLYHTDDLSPEWYSIPARYRSGDAYPVPCGEHVREMGEIAVCM
jgi:hypothetical protein